MARGYPSSAAARRKSDFRDFKPIKPLKPGLPRPRPANDRGTFLQGRRAPGEFGKAEPAFIREQNERFKRNAANLLRQLPTMVLRAVLPEASNVFDLGDNLDHALGGKNPRYIIHPNFAPAGGRSAWMMLNGPNAPKLAYYGLPDQSWLWFSNAYISRGGFDPAKFMGPGTGVIAGQSLSEAGATAGQYTPGVNDTRFGLWYYSGPLGQVPQARGAQCLNFYRPGFAGQPGSYATNDPIDMLNAYGFRQNRVQWFQPAPAPGQISTVIAAQFPELNAPGFNPVPSLPLSPVLGRVIDKLRSPHFVENLQPALPPPAPELPPLEWPEPTRTPVGKPGHNYRRPARREKERKTKLAALHKSLGDILGGFSEVGDFMDALHDALPKKLQAHSWYKGKRVKPSWNKKWNAVYQHFDQIDMNEALQNIIKNNLQDKVIGRISDKANKALGKKPPGVQLDRFRGLRM